MDRFGVIAEFIMICSSKWDFKVHGKLIRVVVASGISGVRKVIWD